MGPTAEHRPAPPAEAASSGGQAPVLEAQGIVTSYRTGLWPRRRALRVLRGADVTLSRGEVVGLDEPYAGSDWDTYLRFWELT